MERDAISFSPVALSDLKAQVVHAFKSVPKRGAEGGGLLCGHFDEMAGERGIRIESIVPVPIEYRFGPTWKLSDRDGDHLRSAIAGSQRVIGWYRSKTRPARLPDNEDHAIARKFFGGLRVMLICHPDADCNVSAKLYIDLGTAVQQCVDLELGRHSLLEEALQACDREEPQAPQVPQVPQLVPKTPLLSGRLRLALVSFFSVATIFASGMFLNNSLSTVPELSGLRAEHQGNSLFVTWNRRDPRIRHARDAAFRIGDGDSVRTLQFSGAELRAGGLLYTPRNEEIRFTLEVHGPEGDSLQTLRVLGTPAY